MISRRAERSIFSACTSEITRSRKRHSNAFAAGKQGGRWRGREGGRDRKGKVEVGAEFKFSISHGRWPWHSGNTTSQCAAERVEDHWPLVVSRSKLGSTENRRRSMNRSYASERERGGERIEITNRGKSAMQARRIRAFHRTIVSVSNHSLMSRTLDTRSLFGFVQAIFSSTYFS